MKRSNLVVFGFAGLVAAVAAQMACSPIGRRGEDQCDGVFENGECVDGTGQGGAGGTGGTGNGQGGDGGDVIIFPAGGGGQGGGGPTCATNPDVDDDGDGATENQGDCNDCDANVGPGAIEVATDPNNPDAQQADEDCDGTIDNVAPASCDAGIALDDSDPYNGAAAVELCQRADAGTLKWGVLDAKYVRANGSPATPGQQIGILSDFGPNVNPQGGNRLLVMSSGRARIASQTGACGSLTCYGVGAGTPPPGFPQDVPSCSGSTSINDDVGLEVKIRPPTNATGYKFSFKFYSFEYPEWVCTSFNDQFISLVNPAPMGSINGNISFDQQTNPVSVNVAFFDVCDGCALGPGEMSGTSVNTWNDAGGTSWLQSQAPIDVNLPANQRDFTIRWTIWDTGDSAWDSTAIVDNFEWIANGGTVTVGTVPIEDPAARAPTNNTF